MTQQTLADFIREHGITMTAREAGSNPHMADSHGMDHWRCTLWRCTLRRDGRRMTVTFSMGSGHNGREPRVAEVLDSLASDAAGVENARGDFDEWASEYGYDTDSRAAERTFKATQRQAQRLATFMDDAYDTLLWNTQRA